VPAPTRPPRRPPRRKIKEAVKTLKSIDRSLKSIAEDGAVVAREERAQPPEEMDLLEALGLTGKRQRGPSSMD
jgi:hypothetical protein